MVKTKIEKLLVGTPSLRGCPCGAKQWDSYNRPTMSVVLQVATLGEKTRRRAKAVTIHVCDKCVRFIFSKHGRAARLALAEAVQGQAVDLYRQKNATYAA